MYLHPSTHLEIARQRHRDSLIRAERHRLARAVARNASRSAADLPAVDESNGLYLRQLRPSDRQALVDAFSELSARSRYQRFASPKSELTSAELDHLTHVDPPCTDALGAFLGRSGRLVGFANWMGGCGLAGPELAVAVVDDWQRRGVGTRLAELLLARARAARHPVLRAHVLAENAAGLSLAKRFGFRSAGRDGLLVDFELFLPGPR